MVLAALSILGGALNLPGLHTLTSWLEHTIEVIQPGEFLPTVALISTGLALLGILLSWLLYGRRTLRSGQADPLQRMLGPIFTGMNRKWFVDEVYEALILRPYVAACRFLADEVDGRFWHDWFHEKVLAGTYNFLSGIALNDTPTSAASMASSTAWRQWTQGGFSQPAPDRERLCAQLRPVRTPGCRGNGRVSVIQMSSIALGGTWMQRPSRSRRDIDKE